MQLIMCTALQNSLGEQIPMHSSTAVHPTTTRMHAQIAQSRALFIILLFVLASVSSINTASFYGLSYIKLPMQDTKNSTELQFRFKTHQLDALLFLAAGSSDYCLVFLESGQVAVKINFGSGETYLASDGLQLNDLVWHKVKLKLIKSHVSLTINEKHSFTQRIKGNSHQLHVSGVFLGKQENFKSVYLGNIRPLRGCIENVSFQNLPDLLQTAFQSRQAIVHNVELECDEQFMASPNSTISFIESDSFVTLPAPNPRNVTALSIEFEVKTISATAMLVFVASPNPYKRQYSAVELIQGKVRFSSNDGTAESSVQSSVLINDGAWHQVAIINSGTSLQVNVDGRLESNRTNSRRQFSSQQYSEEILLGGLSAGKQSVALNYGLESVLIEQNVSIKGCVRNVLVNSRSVSLFDSLVTHHIKTGKCKWHFLCADRDKSPCTEESQCVQRNMNQFSCICSAPNCVRSHFKHKTIVAISEGVAQCKSHRKQVHVLEGSSVILGRDVLRDILHKSKNENLEVKVIALPRHGTLEHAARKNSSLLMETLNLFDLGEGNVQYRHDGSEHYNDSIIFQIQSDTIEPTELISNSTCKQTVVISIQVAPASDAPNKNRNLIKIKMVKNSKKVLTHSLFKPLHKMRAKKEESLQYRVVQIQNGGMSYFERASKPNIHIKEFSESELRGQAIRFVHVAEHMSPLNPIEVTLHIHSTLSERNDREVRLLFEAYEIELTQVANTGLLMAHHTAAVISSANLSYTIGNETEQSQLIKYEIVRAPKHGLIQKLRSSANQWTNATHFSQRQIDRGKVRYVHVENSSMDHRPLGDQVQLRVSFNKQVTQTLPLLISFVDHLQIVHSEPSHYNMSDQEKEVPLDGSKLSFYTEPVRTSASNLMMTLLTVPYCGNLFFMQQSGKQIRLYISSSFTQKDINEGKLSYVKSNSRKCVKDSFELKVTAEGTNSTQIYTFRINFRETDERYALVNNIINVAEGENVTIDSSYLFFGTEQNSNEFMLRVTRQPQHGTIYLLSASQKVSETSPREFSQKYIKDRRLIYAHDDSENDVDNFEFAVINASDQAVANGKFFIEIAMINDNMPIRVIDKPFNVIRNGERFLLASDLKYADADLHTSPSSIVYTKTHIPNGSLLYANNSIVDKFSQTDIDNGLIKFRHSGGDLAKATLWVTDGQFYLSGSLEIRASDPYITVVNNTGIWVKYGESAPITAANLSVETNMDLSNRSNVLFKITAEPRYGQIHINEKVTNQFTLEDLEDELVEYESTVFEDEQELLSRNDTFTFRIFVSGQTQPTSRAVDTYEFCVSIHPHTYFQLNTINQNNLTVFEEQTVPLDSSSLLVEHTELKPDQIVYRITQKPKYGAILNTKLDNLSHMAKQDSQSMSFTQKDINDGHILYKNNKLPTDTYSCDWLSFDVGNEVVSLQKQAIYIEVIPRLITLSTTNVTVAEGHAVVLTEKNLSIAHPHYLKLVDEFIVVEEPKYGSIFSEAASGMALSARSFTLEQLKEGRISYKQDSSEVDRDWFTIVARSTELDKESLPATIHVSINAVNDEAPKIVNNSHVYVWQNGTALISNTNLAAVDEDTSAPNIIYSTYLPTNGYLINIDTNTTIDAFSQSDIDAGRIYFAHFGFGDASFRFHVTDGKNSGVTSVFRVRVRERKMRILANEKLYVVPGVIQSITRRHLQVGANDNQTEIERQFTFHIVKAPSYGRIVLEGLRDQSEPVSHFTQSQIDQNLVLYKQNVSINEPVVTDRIVFSVRSQGLPSLEGVHFLVEIAIEGLKKVIANDMHELMQIVPLKLNEGQFAPITYQHLNLSRLGLETQASEKLCLRVAVAPKHGIMLKGGTAVAPEQCTPLSALADGSLVYMHDHSNTLVDSIMFNLMLIDGVTITLLNLTLPVQILPVNDEFPVVLHRNPILKAVFGSTTLVTNQTLNARDSDLTPPLNLIYQIRNNNASRDSYFMLMPREVPVNEFTQADVNAHRVFFNHRGQDLHFTYWFRVKDDPTVVCEEDDIPEGHFESVSALTSSTSHCTAFYPLKVIVVQLSLQLLNHSTIELTQGTFQVPITRFNLATASKSASPNFIIYKMTKGPFHGYISVEGESDQNEFTQKQVDEQRVHYVQTNMSAEDFFLVDIVQYENLFNEKPIYDVNVKIATKPLIKAVKPYLIASPKQQSLLSYEYLDASELALKTNSNPIFKILTFPRYGYFKLLNFGEELNREPTKESMKASEFTQEDIIRNRVAYVTNAHLDMSYPNEMLIDAIHYELYAPNVQTARGILVVNVFNNKSYLDLETLVSTDNYLHKVDLKVSREMLFLSVFIIASLVVLVCLFVTLRMHSCKNEPPPPCPKHNLPSKSLSHSGNLDSCGRQYSSTSLRQTDCSSRTSSNSALACGPQMATESRHPPMPYELPPGAAANCTLHRTMYGERIDYGNDLITTMRSKERLVGSLNDKSEDISPLPPPSLYFINDNSFDDHIAWNKVALRNLENTETTRPHNYHRASKERMSGDGTSHSNSPHLTSSAIKLSSSKSQPFDQLAHLEEYLSKSDKNGRNENFSTLNKVHKFKTAHAQMRNPYWI